MLLVERNIQFALPRARTGARKRHERSRVTGRHGMKIIKRRNNTFRKRNEENSESHDRRDTYFPFG